MATEDIVRKKQTRSRKKSNIDALQSCVADLVAANRILAHENVVDAYGHVSARHPEKPDHYLLSHSRSPELVTADDIIAFTLEGESDDLRGRTPYGERAIHGGVYEARPDVNAVVHHHAMEIIPFSATGAKLRPIGHASAPIGGDIPVWDSQDAFGDTDLLVETMEQARDLARCLGDARVALMRGHGCVIVAPNLREAVNIAVYLRVAALQQILALQLGTPKFLTPGEVDMAARRLVTPLVIDRLWEYWCRRAGCSEL